MISEYGRTNKGLLYEKHTSQSRASPIVMFTGIGVQQSREDSYLGNVPQKLAEQTGECIVVYQQGVSTDNPLKKGLYTTGTDIIQLQGALELTKGKPFTPVTHSYSAMLGTRLLNSEYREQTLATSAMPGVISGLMTSVKDGTHREDGTSRKILGIPAEYVFLVGQYFPLLTPLYPLKMLADHEHYNEREEHPHKVIADTWINSLSAYACYRQPYSEVHPDQKGLGLVTKGDSIFSADKQKEVLERLGCDIVEIDTGHRWMSGRDTANAIVAKHFHNLRPQ